MSNQTFGRRVNMLEQRRLFDSLEREVREVIARAPFKYDVRGWGKLWPSVRAEGAHAVRSLRRTVIEDIADDMQHQAYRTYGPDHPDAQRNRVTGEPLDNPPKWRGLK